MIRKSVLCAVFVYNMYHQTMKWKVIKVEKKWDKFVMEFVDKNINKCIGTLCNSINRIISQH